MNKKSITMLAIGVIAIVAVYWFFFRKKPTTTTTTTQKVVTPPAEANWDGGLPFPGGESNFAVPTRNQLFGV